MSLFSSLLSRSVEKEKKQQDLAHWFGRLDEIGFGVERIVMINSVARVMSGSPRILPPTKIVKSEMHAMVQRRFELSEGVCRLVMFQARDGAAWATM